MTKLEEAAAVTTLRELHEAASELMDNLPQEVLTDGIVAAHLGRLALALGGGGDLGATPAKVRLGDLRGIVEACNECCTCGGGGPDDGCPACQVFHGIQDMEVKP